MNETTILTVLICLALGSLALLIASGVISYSRAIIYAIFAVAAPAIAVCVNNVILFLVDTSPTSYTLVGILYALIMIPLCTVILFKWYLLIAIVVGLLIRTSLKDRSAHKRKT